jgi:hypothetical protein
MEATVKYDYVGTPGGMTSQLQRCFDGFGTTITKEKCVNT